MSEAIIPSDFSVNVVTGVDPLRLKLRFRLHNGSASSIHLNGRGYLSFPFLLTVLKVDRPYEMKYTEGKPISKNEARRLILSEY